MWALEGAEAWVREQVVGQESVPAREEIQAPVQEKVQVVAKVGVNSEPVMAQVQEEALVWELVSQRAALAQATL